MQTKNKRLPHTGTFSVLFDLDEKSSNFFIEISKDILKNFKTEFVVDGGRYHPHVTLYLFSAPVRNTKKIVDKLSFMVVNIKPAKLKIGKLVSSSDGWVMAELVSIGKIRKYQELIIKVLNPLRENAQRKKYRNLKFVKSLPEDEQRNLKSYGNRYVFNLYYPHISLAKVNSAKEARKIVEKYESRVIGREVYTRSLSYIRDIGGPKGNSMVLFKKDLN